MAVQSREPNFIYTNNFKSRIFSWLRKNPDWTLAEYRARSKDKVSAQWAFDDVRNDIKLYGLWDPVACEIVPNTASNRERLEALNRKNETEKELPPSAPIEAPPSIANQIAMLTETKQKFMPKRKFLNEDLKTLAEELIVKNPEITFDQIQEALKWEDFKAHSFYNMRRNLCLTGQIPNVLGKTRGIKLSGNAVLARQNLGQLTVEQIREMTFPEYKGKFGHHGCEGKEFIAARVWAIKQLSPRLEPVKKDEPVELVNPVKLVNPVVAEITPVAPPAQLVAKDAYEILAELDLSRLGPEQRVVVRDIFKDYFAKRMPNANSAGKIKLALQSDPPILEIRKAVKVY